MKLLSENQSRILDLLKEHSQLSVDEIAERLNGAKTAIRRHLLSMERRGLLEREYQAAERGRPSLKFRLSLDAKKLFPTKEAELLSDLIDYLTREGHEEILEKFFENYWQKRFVLVSERIKQKGRDDFETRLEVLKEVLEDEGFMPSAQFEKRGQELLLRQCHCPIEAASQFTRIPCRLEKRFIAKVLNTPVSSMELKCDAHSSCDFRLPVSKIKKS